jgi:hypothetical protein
MPKWLLPSLATLIVVGGTVAIAGATDGEQPPQDEPVATTLVTTTTAAPDDGAPDDGAPESEDSESGDRYWGPECGDGEPTNHGQYVSSSDKGGASRSEAAHSPCGKPIESTDVPPVTEPPAPSDDDGTEVGDDEGTDEAPDEGTDDAPDTETSDSAPGHSDGHGPH